MKKIIYSTLFVVSVLSTIVFYFDKNYSDIKDKSTQQNQTDYIYITEKSSQLIVLMKKD